MNTLFRKMTLKLSLRIAVIASLAGFATPAFSTGIVNMCCEYAVNPITVDTQTPRFTWQYSGKGNFIQDRYQVTVSSVDAIGKTAIVWKSAIRRGAMPLAQSDRPLNLKSFTRHIWQVTAWDKNGKAVTSPKASFETAMLSESDWQGSWITDSNDKDFHPAPMFRKEFVTTGKKIKSARLYISAAGYYSAYINGVAVTNAVLDPGYTAYDHRNLYSVHDVTPLVGKGANTVTAVLGNGFYNVIDNVATWRFEEAPWRGRPRMIANLRITYSDGSTQVVATDQSWRTATGPFLQDNIYSGDTYDARLEMPGWELAGFDDSKWQHATATSAPSPILKAQSMPPIRTEETLRAVDFHSWGDTVFVYDFGKNISGFCKLLVAGEPGTTLKLTHGETLKENGRVETGNIDIYYNPQPGLEFQTDVLILGDKPVEFTPRFNYHGFQYVEVRSDRPVSLNRESLNALFFHTDVTETGSFKCSNELLNRINKAAKQSYLCNLMSIPTDCPQREKNGWTADAYISMELGLLNYNGIKVYEKWLEDIVDNQRGDGRISGIVPTGGWGYEDWVSDVWDAAMFIVPLHLYQYYGDKHGIEIIWNTCERYLKYLNSRENEDGVVTYGTLGDWVFFKTATPAEYTTACFYFLENRIMAQFAELLGKDGAEYAAKARYLKDYINNKYFDRQTCLYSNGSQAAQSVALYLELVPDGLEQKVADNLSRLISENGDAPDFGMLGTKTVLRMLTRYGHVEQAMKLALREEMPSWGYWLTKCNTLGEKWDLFANFRDDSYNHVFFGDIAAWFINDIAGINFDKNAPGFSSIIIRPHFVSDLNWARATYNSPQGLIASSWKRVGDKVELEVTVPANTQATLIVGDKSQKLNVGTHKFKF